MLLTRIGLGNVASKRHFNLTYSWVLSISCLLELIGQSAGKSEYGDQNMLNVLGFLFYQVLHEYEYFFEVHHQQFPPKLVLIMYGGHLQLHIHL